MESSVTENFLDCLSHGKKILYIRTVCTIYKNTNQEAFQFLNLPYALVDKNWLTVTHLQANQLLACLKERDLNQKTLKAQNIKSLKLAITGLMVIHELIIIITVQVYIHN